MLQPPFLQETWVEPSLQATPHRGSDVPDIGAVVLESPQVPHMLSDFATGSSAGSSVDGEASPVIAGKFGPNDFELLRVVGQGAFGKVSSARCSLQLEQHRQQDLFLCRLWRTC